MDMLGTILFFIVLVIIIWAIARAGNKGIQAAPIVSSAAVAGVNRDYRLPGDPRHVIRINQQWPDGIGASLIKKVGPLRDGVPVKGVSKEGRHETLTALIRGSSRRIELVRDRGNDYDPNAIKVIAHWKDAAGSSHEGQIGWIPRDISKEIAHEHPDTPLGGKILLMYQPRRGKNPGIRIDIGRPSSRGRSKESPAKPGKRIESSRQNRPNQGACNPSPREVKQRKKA